MNVLDLMSSPAVTCHVNDTCQTAAQRMRERDCGAIAVINDEGRLTGIITDRDICMAAAKYPRALADILVNTAMTTMVITARGGDRIRDVEERMAYHRVRRLPVIDDSGRPIGMFALDDVARTGTDLAQVGRTLAALTARQPETAGPV